MTRKTRTATILIAGALAVGLTAAPASALWSDCPSGYACVWTSTSYPGSPNAKTASLSNLADVSNRGNSIVNNGKTSVARYYDLAGCSTGSYIVMNNPARGGQSRDPLLSNGTDATTANWANKISCVKFS
ncbi:MAG: peptidase inhibitor family I36 protein [Cellulomonadaceae bacterium]|jgi:hypothetical protein|nr:peptidase inhibitor family I36 protein [Cellulomonadaceae bacterium]